MEIFLDTSEFLEEEFLLQFTDRHQQPSTFTKRLQDRKEIERKERDKSTRFPIYLE